MNRVPTPFSLPAGAGRPGAVNRQQSAFLRHYSDAHPQ